MTLVEARWTARDGILRSPALGSLGLVAGFTTRALGSMAGGVYPLDEQARNRDRLAARLGFDRLVRLKQVHGDRVVHADEAGEPWPEADAMWTATPGLLLGVAAADCVPILVADPGGPIGAAHAGWQGTSRRIVQALVAELARHGARPARLVAAIGPSIGPCCYEVDAPVIERLERAFPGGWQAWVTPKGPGKWMLDLWQANVDQLTAAGVPAERIDLLGLCTGCRPDLLFSYRRERGAGRLVTVAALPVVPAVAAAGA